MKSLRRRCARLVWLIALGAAPLACNNEAPPAGAARPAAETPRAQAPAGAQPPGAPDASLKPSASTMAPTPGTVLNATELKDKPQLDAKTLKNLPAQTALAILDRQGGWLRVNAGGQQGWVRLLHVSTQPPGGRGTAQELESAAKIATGRAGGGNIVATSGIRGLSEEQLRTAKPAPEQLKRLEGYSATPEQARDYARAHKLERRQVSYVAEPR